MNKHSFRVRSCLGTSMENFQTQLALLLGKDTIRVRKTDEVPGRISVIDLISGILDLNSNNAAFTWARLRKDHPSIVGKSSFFKFKGRGQIWIGLDWLGLDWIGLDWLGIGVGLDLERIGLD